MMKDEARRELQTERLAKFIENERTAYNALKKEYEEKNCCCTEIGALLDKVDDLKKRVDSEYDRGIEDSMMQVRILSLAHEMDSFLYLAFKRADEAILKLRRT